MSRIRGTRRKREDTGGHEGRRNRVQEDTGGTGRTREDTIYAGFGTVRPKQAEILTAKLTAILSDIGAYQRPSADPSCCVFILRGYRWTLADARTAVFKTAGSGAAPQGHRRVLSYSNAGGKWWHLAVLSC